MAKVQIQFVVSQHQRFLERLLGSLKAQTFKDFTIVMVENGSEDGSIATVRERFPEVMILKNVRNLGPAAAHNQALRYAFAKWPTDDVHSKFVLVLEPTIRLEPKFLEELLRDAGRHPEAATFGGKFLKMFEAKGEDPDLQQVDESHLVDSAGIVLGKFGKTVVRGDGELDSNQFASSEVWANSPGAVLYRAEAMKKVAPNEIVFDEAFQGLSMHFDLAWRLSNLGLKHQFVPSASAYQYRGNYSEVAQKSSEEKNLNRKKFLQLAWKNGSFWSYLWLSVRSLLWRR